MDKYTEPKLSLGALLTEGEGQISRDEVIFADGTDIPASAVVGKITASGKYVELDPAASDGSQTAAGFTLYPIKADGADVKGVIIARLAEAKGPALEWPTGITEAQTATAIGHLANLNIVVR